MRLSAAAAIAAALAVSSLPATANDLSLEPEAIAALFPGHYEARVAGGYVLMIAAKEDGSMMGRAFGKEDKGVWKLEDDKLCVSWNSWTRGKFKCGSIVQNGDWYVAINAQGGDTMQFRPVDRRVVMSAQVGQKRRNDR
ncbi:MAG: hypothetical protein V2I51_11395 [Anderseniella sp.]|jgi:hypothetical protein|nr:hypothetical protein [Anderseniella sp.]